MFDATSAPAVAAVFQQDFYGRVTEACWAVTTAKAALSLLSTAWPVVKVGIMVKEPLQ